MKKKDTDFLALEILRDIKRMKQKPKPYDQNRVNILWLREIAKGRK